MKDLEQRLHNLEVAFMAYIEITKDLLPPAAQESVDNMCEDFLEADMHTNAFCSSFFKDNQEE